MSVVMEQNKLQPYSHQESLDSILKEPQRKLWKNQLNNF